MKGDGLIVDTRCTDHVVRDKVVYFSFGSCNCGEHQRHAVEDLGQTISEKGDQGLP